MTPKQKFYFFLIIGSMVIHACKKMEFREERQLTKDLSYNHDLDNNDNFSPNDQWLVYDTRTEEGGIGGNATIEKVQVETGEKKVLYHLPRNTEYGPGVGAVSYSHTGNRVAFIHGLMNCSKDNPYEQWRRTGVIIDDQHPNRPIFMDARDVEPPYTLGALRGGTHRHEWSGDGKFIGFTYNDAIMKKLEDSTGKVQNLRTIGVSKIGQKVTLGEENEESFSGESFSVLVVTVVPEPKPGSDEISRAAGDSWVGHDGYLTKDGKKQRARAFIGTVKNSKGSPMDEVFIVDIPEDVSVARENKPLEGTDLSLPNPPLGTSQRRLTYTAEGANPGCEGIVRSSFDGSSLAYLAFDKKSVKQVFVISPWGGKPEQLTFHRGNVQSGARWHPKKQQIVYVQNNSIILKNIGSDDFQILTEPREQAPTNLVWSHDGKTIAYNRMVKNNKGVFTKQIFLIEL